jgi:hypothetical protein
MRDVDGYGISCRCVAIRSPNESRSGKDDGGQMSDRNKL